jgi:uridine phosphorylase
MASEITHVFGLMGTRIVVQTGVCGALADDLQAGDIVIATSAGCGDGAVACYSPAVERAHADESLVTSVKSLAGSERTFVGPIWTTAALLAEGRDDIERWAAQGFIAVDMETATALGVATWTGMRAVSVLSVFDNPRAGDHLALDDRTKDTLRTRGEQRLNEIVLGLISDV